MQGWAACTKVTRPSFNIVLLEGNCSLECSQPANCLAHCPVSFRSLLRCPFPSEAILSTQFETSSLLHSTPELHSYPSSPLNFFPLPLLSPDMLSILRVDLSISCPLPLHYKLHEGGIFFYLPCLLLKLCLAHNRHSNIYGQNFKLLLYSTLALFSLN